MRALLAKDNKDPLPRAPLARGTARAHRHYHALHRTHAEVLSDGQHALYQRRLRGQLRDTSFHSGDPRVKLYVRTGKPSRYDEATTARLDADAESGKKIRARVRQTPGKRDMKGAKSTGGSGGSGLLRPINGFITLSSGQTVRPGFLYGCGFKRLNYE
jgi:hypothetical protein